MDTKINRTGKFSLISILTILIFALCFLSYSPKPLKAEDSKTQAESGIKEGSVQKTHGTSFEEIYEELDIEIRSKLEKPVTLIFSNTPVDMVIIQISKQIDVNIIANGFKERVDCVYQDIPAVKALEMLSKDKSWHWEKSALSLYIYPNPIPQSVYLKFEEFRKSLDEETIKKLQTPVTLIFSNAKLDEILPRISKQTGITIISRGIDTRITMIYYKIPAISILENLVKSYLWKLEMTDGVIVISPLSQPSSGDIEDRSIPLPDQYTRKIKEARFRFFLFKILGESPEILNEKIRESCANGDVEEKLNQWKEEKSLEIIDAPLIVKKGTDPEDWEKLKIEKGGIKPVEWEISTSEIHVKIQINVVRLQGRNVHANLAVEFNGKTENLKTGMDITIKKQGQYTLISTGGKGNTADLNQFGAVCKVETITFQDSEDLSKSDQEAAPSEHDERIKAHRERIEKILERRKKEREKESAQ
ncbi:hypothetical protein JW926_17365 [Candidatus Sumerlaeota bacterium]|nr:hypothetical protein [Candidatus Sumerlaeota bacterium]